METIRKLYGNRHFSLKAKSTVTYWNIKNKLVGAAGFEPTTTTPPVMWLKPHNVLISFTNTLFFTLLKPQISQIYIVDLKRLFSYTKKLLGMNLNTIWSSRR